MIKRRHIFTILFRVKFIRLIPLPKCKNLGFHENRGCCHGYDPFKIGQSPVCSDPGNFWKISNFGISELFKFFCGGNFEIEMSLHVLNNIFKMFAYISIKFYAAHFQCMWSSLRLCNFIQKMMAMWYNLNLFCQLLSHIKGTFRDHSHDNALKFHKILRCLHFGNAIRCMNLTWKE